jgi:hypothetical protein
MVMITITKMTETFIVEASVNDSVEDVTKKAATMHNTRMRVRRLVGAVRQLVKYGPMKPHDKHGLSEEQINAKGNDQLYTGDPLGMREGKPCDKTVGETLLKCATTAEVSVSNELAKRRMATDMEKIQECIQNIKGAVMMAYPMGLPDWDPVSCAIDDEENLEGTEDSKYVLDVDTCSMWFAGKQMMRDQALSKYVGKNEKCIIKAKLEKKGSGAPAREPAVDEETRKAMMARWHKKQEEEKKLAEDDEDAFQNSAWANPKEWKNNIAGVGNIRIR